MVAKGHRGFCCNDHAACVHYAGGHRSVYSDSIFYQTCWSDGVSGSRLMVLSHASVAASRNFEISRVGEIENNGVRNIRVQELTAVCCCKSRGWWAAAVRKGGSTSTRRARDEQKNDWQQCLSQIR